MSVRPVTYYTVQCDVPGCARVADQEEYGDFSAWGEAGSAVDQLDGTDWRHDVDGERHYCPDHPARWDVDLETGEEPPPAPYVLLLDSAPYADRNATLVLEEGSR